MSHPTAKQLRYLLIRHLHPAGKHGRRFTAREKRHRNRKAAQRHHQWMRDFARAEAAQTAAYVAEIEASGLGLSEPELEDPSGDWIDCADCDGAGSFHECGEDACSCLYPETDDRVDCHVCRGEGGYWSREGIDGGPDEP